MVDRSIFGLGDNKLSTFSPLVRIANKAVKGTLLDGMIEEDSLYKESESNSNSIEMPPLKRQSTIESFKSSGLNQNASQVDSIHGKHSKIKKKARIYYDEDFDDAEEEKFLIPEVEVVKLTWGEYFGELALQDNRPRLATIKCLTDCNFGTISKDTYIRCLSKIEEKIKTRNIQFLSEIPYFSTLSKNHLGNLLRCFTFQEYKRG